jgi:hypothetical protein
VSSKKIHKSREKFYLRKLLNNEDYPFDLPGIYQMKHRRVDSATDLLSRSQAGLGNAIIAPKLSLGSEVVPKLNLGTRKIIAHLRRRLKPAATQAFIHAPRPHR